MSQTLMACNNTDSAGFRPAPRRIHRAAGGYQANWRCASAWRMSVSGV
jgi:hypothetical protein